MNQMDVFNELIKKEPNLLDRPLKDLLPISFVGVAAVAAYRSLVSKLDDLPMTEEQKRKTLADGQDAGKMLLAIEGRIGELLPTAEEGRRIGVSEAAAIRDGKLERSTARPEGIGEKQAFNARIISNNPDAVEEVIKEAEENEDIPTKTAVLNKVRLKKYQEKHPPTEIERPDISEVALTISNKLADCYAKLIKLWDEREYIPDSLQDSIVDTIEKLYTLIGE